MSSKKLAVVSAAILGGLSLTACATPNYDDEFAALNGRISAVEATANAAAATANAAAADARNANTRLDALTTRVETVERTTTVTRMPRN